MSENSLYLTTQIVTYLGNKRSLLNFIDRGAQKALSRLKRNKMRIFDVFSGSGIVARYFKQYASTLIANDLESYSKIINECYLTNKSAIDLAALKSVYQNLIFTLENGELKGGLIAENFAPKDDDNIQKNERVFYTNRNAKYIDSARSLIGDLESEIQRFFLAPLLSEASIHSNTSGVFKGFYKNSETKIGAFGGKAQNALERIKGEIKLPFPVFSDHECEIKIYQEDANKLIDFAPETDLAYLDPPYNQHPYGSNYFMLNAIVQNRLSDRISKVSGIPAEWNRSQYNKKQFAAKALFDLTRKIRAKFVLISFNSEGFITLETMKKELEKIGKLEIMETKYNAFRGSRNLSKRAVHTKEFLFFLEK